MRAASHLEETEEEVQVVLITVKVTKLSTLQMLISAFDSNYLI